MLSSGDLSFGRTSGLVTTCTQSGTVPVGGCVCKTPLGGTISCSVVLPSGFAAPGGGVAQNG